MRKLFLGKPSNPGEFESRHRWLLHCMHEIELASGERDPEFDDMEKRHAEMEARLAAIEARLTALENPP